MKSINNYAEYKDIKRISKLMYQMFYQGRWLYEKFIICQMNSALALISVSLGNFIINLKRSTKL